MKIAFNLGHLGLCDKHVPNRVKTEGPNVNLMTSTLPYLLFDLSPNLVLKIQSAMPPQKLLYSHPYSIYLSLRYAGGSGAVHNGLQGVWQGPPLPFVLSLSLQESTLGR